MLHQHRYGQTSREALAQLATAFLTSGVADTEVTVVSRRGAFLTDQVRAVADFDRRFSAAD